MDRKKSDQKYNEKIKEAKKQFYLRVGKNCFICDSEHKLVCHRKDFKKHKRIANLTLVQVLKENPEEYARLCFPCHYGVHFAHNYFKLSWNDIVQNLRKLK